MGRRCKARSASRPEAREAAIKHMMEGVAAMKTSEKGLIKSIHGGGGKGTGHLLTPDKPEAVRAACEKVPGDSPSSLGTHGCASFVPIKGEVYGSVHC